MTKRQNKVDKVVISPKAKTKVPELHVAQWHQAVALFLEQAHQRYIYTNNPMWVWDAIAVCDRAGFPRYPLPEWCLIYLTTASHTILMLGQLRDALTYPVMKPSESRDQYHDRVTAWSAQPKITPTEAKNCIPKALGFVQSTSNNIYEYYKDNQKIIEAQINENPPASIGDPVKWVTDRNRFVSDDLGRRKARARLDRGEKLLHPE